MKKFERIGEIAEFYKIPVASLRDTVERFNSYVAKGCDEDFGKPILSNSEPLDNPPYFCVRLWPKVHYTMGGILINSKAQVIDLTNQPMKGFYAAGEVTGGVHGACRLGSCAIADCLVFGRIAGKNAAKE